ncbi:MAG: MBOAT family protein [Bacteroidales bacterium]|nr:MBOAT family protein [Bacteroidales bacterium]
MGGKFLSMLFNSFQFLAFFPLVIIFYYSLPHKWRWALLLAASYYFYMCWKAEYIFLILFSTAIDYWAGLQMGKTTDRQKRKKFLVLSLIVNLGLLFSFKYFNFVNDSVRSIFDHYNLFYGVPAFNVLLPVGISFYTFQTISYSIDIYRGRSAPEKHFGRFALYVAFFPQLVAGPIERSIKLLPQFSKKIEMNGDQILSGLKLMLWGFFKKIVIADRLAMYVGSVFMHPEDAYGVQVLMASFLLHVQVYTDLSGYTDIARGAARVMGIDLIKNFNNPLFSRSLYDFWKRWHISLTTWFTDYLYIPLGGNRVVKWRWYYNIFIVFLISGLWHGANWTFVMWGALHGFFQLMEIWTDKSRKKFFDRIGISKFPTLMKTLGVSAQLAMLSTTALFFGARNISEAFTLIKHIFEIGNVGRTISMFMRNNDYSLGIVLVAALFLVEYLQSKYNLVELLKARSVFMKYPVYMAAIFMILIFGVFEQLEFIYFQF